MSAVASKAEVNSERRRPRYGPLRVVSASSTRVKAQLGNATVGAPASERRSTSIEIRRSRLASERPPKKGVASKNAFRSGELTAIAPIYPRSRQRQVRKPSFAAARLPVSCDGSAEARGLVCVTRQF